MKPRSKDLLLCSIIIAVFLILSFKAGWEFKDRKIENHITESGYYDISRNKRICGVLQEKSYE